MRISLNTVKSYTNVELSVDDLVVKINAQLGGVEKIIDLGARYEHATIVKIVSAEQHPNADRLRICKVDDGGQVQDITRDENGYVQIVCGAPNAREGIFAVWLPPKSTVPASYDEKELFILDSRELRGVVSHGMLAAADELAIGSDHEGILEIDPTEWKPSEIEITAGASFAKVYGLDDTVIDIENKMFTHRPDLFGQIGVAREIAGIQHQVFDDPSWISDQPQFEDADDLKLNVFNDITDNVPRLMAVALKNIAIRPSPLWLQCELVRFGGKPINNIVDATNYIMLLTAQPTHAYDYDKIRGATIGSRMAKADESITLLNGKTYKLDENDIVIADGNGPIGLAGIMGGGESEVSNDTKNIILEVGTFDMYTLRKSSMRHGVFTDALTRFNKGQSPLQNDRVLAKLMELIKQVSAAEQASKVYDLRSPSEVYERQSVHGTINVEAIFINDRLGLSLTEDEIQRLLGNVHFTCVVSDDSVMNISAPYWRTDIEFPEDIVEEVGRLYGFDRLPRELPKRSAKPVVENERRQLAKTIRESLARAGASEVLTYSFVHEHVLTRAGQNAAEAYKLSNALSPDLQYYRLGLTPSLLDKVHANIKSGYNEFALFELGKGHSKKAPLDTDALPAEYGRIALTVASKHVKAGAPYYQAKQLLEYLSRSLGLMLTYKPIPSETSLTVAQPFEPLRSARVVDELSGQVIGVVGEYRNHVKNNFKLPNDSAGFELMIEGLLLASKHRVSSYRPLSKYPSVERDICFKVTNDVTYQQIVGAAAQGVLDKSIEVSISPLDIYQAKNAKTKNVTIRIKLSPENKTLSGKEATGYIEEIVLAVNRATDAVVV